MQTVIDKDTQWLTQPKDPGDLPRDARVYLYGCGAFGRQVHDYLSQERPDVTVLGYLDTFRCGQGQTPPIIKMTQLKACLEPWDLILITSQYVREIENVLLRSGYTRDRYKVVAPEFQSNSIRTRRKHIKEQRATSWKLIRALLTDNLKAVIVRKYERITQRLLYTSRSIAHARNRFSHLPRHQANQGFLYYNSWGRFLYALKECVRALLFRSSKTIQMECLDHIDYSKVYQPDHPGVMWPLPVLYEYPPDRHDVDPNLVRRLEEAYALSYALSPLHFPQSPWWKKNSDLFRQAYFDKEGHLDSDLLSRFRDIRTSQAGLLNDQLQTIHPQHPYLYSFIKSLGVVLEYHRYSEIIDPTFLKFVSESFVGHNKCPVYRGQRISRRILRHAYYLSRIATATRYPLDASLKVLDLGGGYGALTRILASYYKKSCHILIELPEVGVLAGYFLTNALAHKRVATLADIDMDRLKSASWDWGAFDLYILPPWTIQYLEDQSIDLVVNTTSLGEMSREYGVYYLEHIERITAGYFYSNNRSHSNDGNYGDFGFLKWPLGSHWRTVLYDFSPSGHIEWMGKA